MKHVRSFLAQVAAYGVAVAIVSYAVSAQAQTKEGTARVQAVRGTAQYSEQGGPWLPLSTGKILKAGTVIKTAPGSQVDLFLKQNGPVVRVTEDTTLGLDRLLYEDTGADLVIETRLNLVNGRILGNVKKMAAASRYEVKVPTGTVGIRGTEYDISTTGIVYVRTGQVLVTYVSPMGKRYEVIVNTGEYFVPPADPEAPPAPPTTLPPSEWSAIEWAPIPPPEVVLPTGAVITVRPLPSGVAQPQEPAVTPTTPTPAGTPTPAPPRGS